jgi:hypothetical protein
MFTSKEYLHHKLDVDPEIAAFFVDRKVPENNIYWKGRYLYVASGTGYLFIPIYFDLQYRLGLSKKQLLDPLHVEICEAGLHSAALYEFEKITFRQHIENVKLLVSPYIKNQVLFDDLSTYFDNEALRPYKYLGTFSKPLNRADTYLFTLTTLEATAVQFEKMIDQWYALIPSFLLMDDLTDLQEDTENNEENSVTDFGPGSVGVEKAIEYLRLKFTYLKSVNQSLGEFFERSLEQKLHTPYMQAILNNQYGT